MKSRSHRLPAFDPPDDWVNGSWTVDCVCGVNFDDGEEMVNCDECGVWVHTRCSRFIKGQKSFACDKCKSKNSRNDSEETEVAQLLVELPTKTMKMSNNNRCPANKPPPRRPYRLWIDRPMEDRVHVQGIPGGDPSLFQGMSSIFTAELWKCSGYMPKKFNYQYKEFPCWDKQKTVDCKAAEDSENMVDRGADVLYSLSKDSLATAPDAALAGVRSQVDGGSSAKKSQKGKRYDGLDAQNKGLQTVVEKQRSLMRPIVIHSGKRKRDDTGTRKERISKKKSKDYETKTNKSSPAVKTAFGPPAFGRTTESVRDKSRIKVIKRGQGQEVPLTEAASDAFAASCDSGKLRSSPAFNECNLEALSPGMTGHGYMADKKVHVDKNRNGASECSHKTDEKLPSAGAQDDDDDSIPPKKEVMSLDNVENGVQTSPETDAVESLKLKTKAKALGSAPIQNSKDPRKSENGVLCLVHAMRRTAADAGANSKGVQKHYSSRVDDVKVEVAGDLAENVVLSSSHISENGKTNDAGVCSSNSAAQKLNQDKGNEAASDRHMEKHDDDVPGMSSQAQQEVLQSECSMEKEKFSTESKQVIKGAEETSKLDVTVLSPSASSSQRKLASLGKSVSSSSDVAISRSSSTDKYKSSSSQQSDSVIKRALSNSVIYTKKDNTASALVRSDDKHELLRSTAKERPKLTPNHAPKGQNPTKIPDSSSKHSSGEAKDFVKHPSSKISPVERSSLLPTVAETSSSSKAQDTPVLQNKNIASPAQSKVEKGVKSNTLSSSKGIHSSLGYAGPSSTPTAGLSDEELALLLHQELNSSLRVPRIPRVRQAGSLSQLSPVAGTNAFSKRSPSSSTKDQHLFPRRKSKDVHKDGTRSSREQENKVKKVDRVPSSPDSSKTTDTSNHAEINSEALDSARKNAPQSSAPSASNVASSSADSPRNNSDDDAGTKGPLHRTLPGLIAEIMSKGQRMTYEELCNAVLPHWHNLRKHNGEKYAYSSPSQAVLDCLRNRAEWAQLVDRGPKTNASRKRRKLDSEGQNTESEDSEYGEGRNLKRSGIKNLEPSREEFPKGKRNARKRRRLALHGRNVKDVRKRKGKVVSDDDSPSFSNPSEQSPCTEDESEGDAVGGAGSEDSASSDDTGNTP